MNIEETEEHKLLRDTVRTLLQSSLPVDKVQKLVDVEGWDDGELWDELSAIGLSGMLLPESSGGGGFGFAGLTIVAEEIGRALAPDAVVANGVGTILLEACGGAASPLLRSVADGERVAAALGRGARARTTAGGSVVSGRCALVPEAGKAGILVVECDLGGGPAVVVLRRGGRGVMAADAPTIDPTRRRYDVVLEEAEVSAVLATGTEAASALERARTAETLAAAADSIGAAQKALDLAVEYAKVREQFDTKIGAFQSIKHLLVDTYVAVKNARAAMLYASRAVDAGQADGALAVMAAKVLAGQAGVQAGANAVQVLGGIGFTKEVPAHLYLRRAKLNEASAGSTIEHLKGIGDRLEEVLAW